MGLNKKHNENCPRLKWIWIRVNADHFPCLNIEEWNFWINKQDEICGKCISKTKWEVEELIVWLVWEDYFEGFKSKYDIDFSKIEELSKEKERIQK